MVKFFLQQKYLLIIFVILLSSCSSHIARKDGPPNFYVDETRIPNAKPKPERLSKFGNMSFYRVFGKRYHVMRSSRNYDEVGTASWYGTQFHARRTSSGERYNMLGMTAAHKTLPLPTYVEVTNLANQRRIIVKVNDRGPFLSNRIIDLSYVAAKKLGMLGRGTAHVRVRAINPYSFHRHFFFAQNKKQRAPNQFIAPRSGQLVYLQVGAFRNRANALRLKLRLTALLSMPVTISTKANLYRVQVGPIRDHMTADKLTQRLKILGIKSNKIIGA